MTWDENKHPRDNEGKFTFKYGSNSDSSQDGTPVLKGRVEKADKVEKTEKTDKGSLDRVLDGIDFSEIKDILYDVISTSLPSIVKVGLTVAQMKNTIKAYNLENEVIKKIENIKTKDKDKNKNKERDNHLSSKTSLSDYSKNKRHGNKERPTDILYHSSNIKEQQRLKESEYKSRLLDILGNRATNADVLYSKPEELERKIKEYGLGNELNKTFKPTISAQSSNKTQSNTNPIISSNEYGKPTINGKITSPYGYRIHPVYKTKKFHDGIDINVGIGTPIYAVTSGKVTFAGKKTGYGNYIEIKYKNFKGDNITTFYAHLNDFKTKDGKTLKTGQIVKKGEQIGHSGNTGIGTGAHLHFGTRKNDKSVNPVDIIGNVYPNIKK